MNVVCAREEPRQPSSDPICRFCSSANYKRMGDQLVEKIPPKLVLLPGKVAFKYLFLINDTWKPNANSTSNLKTLWKYF